jgi:hypothetical protein
MNKQFQKKPLPGNHRFRIDLLHIIDFDFLHELFPFYGGQKSPLSYKVQWKWHNIFILKLW